MHFLLLYQCSDIFLYMYELTAHDGRYILFIYLKRINLTDTITYLQVFPCTMYHYQSVVAIYAYNIISHIIQELIHTYI